MWGTHRFRENQANEKTKLLSTPEEDKGCRRSGCGPAALPGSAANSSCLVLIMRTLTISSVL